MSRFLLPVLRRCSTHNRPLPRDLLPVLRRYTTLNRPSPIPLPIEQQREYERLQRAAQTPLANTNATPDDLQLHPDAREPLKPDFEGDINPATGEQGGPLPIKSVRISPSYLGYY